MLKNMTWLSRRGVHIILALVLIGCALSPFVEMAFHSHQSIFQSGYDTESIVAVLILLLELTFVFARALAVISSAIERMPLVALCHFVSTNSVFRTVLPEISPPLSLRI